MRTQVDLWNQNPTVQRLGLELKTKLLKTLETLPDTPDPTSLQTFKKVLVEVGLSGSPSNATPGLSQHGQAKAFDFVVFKGARSSLGPSPPRSRKSGMTSGWTANLKKAVQDAGGKFVGPLASPYEPWHYIYKTAVATTEGPHWYGQHVLNRQCGTSLRRR